MYPWSYLTRTGRAYRPRQGYEQDCDGDAGWVIPDCRLDIRASAIMLHDVCEKCRMPIVVPSLSTASEVPGLDHYIGLDVGVRSRISDLCRSRVWSVSSLLFRYRVHSSRLVPDLRWIPAGRERCTRTKL